MGWVRLRHIFTTYLVGKVMRSVVYVRLPVSSVYLLIQLALTLIFAHVWVVTRVRWVKVKVKGQYKMSVLHKFLLLRPMSVY